MARILITDGSKRSSLAIVRSLGRAGDTCTVAASELPALSTVSRHCDAAIRFDFGDLASVTDLLETTLAEREIDLLVPTTDDAITCLLEVFPSRRVGGARIAVGPVEAYDALSDKVRLMDLAREMDLPVPRSIRAKAERDLLPAAREIGIPCVLKPHRSVVMVNGRTRHLYVRFVRTSGELEAMANSFPSEAYPVLVQEAITGPGEGVFLFWDGHKTLAASAHRRIREYPPSGGASTYRESIPVRTELLRAAEALLTRTGWEGMAMVELKRSTDDGRAYLMEVNARPWGSLQLAIDSGVDYPRIMADHFLDRCPPTSDEYRVGTRTRCFWGDFEWALTQMVGSHEVRTPVGAKVPRSRWRELASLLRVRLRPMERLEEFHLTDPRPFFFGFRRHVLDRIRES